jgi:hypothetical protein
MLGLREAFAYAGRPLNATDHDDEPLPPMWWLPGGPKDDFVLNMERLTPPVVASGNGFGLFLGASEQRHDDATCSADSSTNTKVVVA